MNPCPHAQHEVSGDWLLGFHAVLRAVREIAVNREPKLCAQIGHRVSVEADDVTDAKDASDEDVVALVKLDACGVVLVCHGVHGVTPIRSSSSRASSTWYFLASLPGCGRWACQAVPCTVSLTREPSTQYR